MSGKAYANDFAVCGLPLGHHFQFSSKKRTPKLDRLRLCKPDPGIRASLMQLRTALPSARVDQQTGSFSQHLAQSDLSMLSSSPASCTSPSPGTDNPDKKVHWASEKRRRASSTDSESKTHLDISKLPRSRRPSRLTVKYDRGHLQRWLEMEQWVDAQVQELFQGQEESSEPEIDLEALMDLSTEDQRTQLEAILQDCPGNREPFISELLSQLKRLRRLSRPSK